MREHITKAASALHAAGDRRHLALVHSLSGISLAQLGPLRRSDGRAAAGRAARRRWSRPTTCSRPSAATRRTSRCCSTATSRRSRSPSAASSLHEAHGSGPRPRGRARHARTDLRPPRRSRPRRRRAAPRARSAQPDSVSRDDRRRLRHAGADSPDPRPLRHRQRISRRAPARPTAPTAGRPASGTSGRFGCSAPGWRCGAATLDEAVARADEILQAGAPPFDALQATLIAAEALTAGEPARRGRAAAGRRPPTRSIREVAPAAWGEYLRLRGALHAEGRQRRRRVPRLLAERGAARSARRALSGRAQSSRARPAGRRNRRALGGRASSRIRALAIFAAARRRARPRRHATPRRRC